MYNPVSLLKRSFQKSYYGIAERILRKKIIQLPEEFQNKRNVFLYFDYEREFSGNKTEIVDNDILKILDVLDHNLLKSTWFTVGRIFELYPESVKEILKRGHEVGSHTYDHIMPIKSKSDCLEKDFNLFHEVCQPFTRVAGFHSPGNGWSLGMMKYLRAHEFSYDIILCTSSRHEISIIPLNNNYKLLRFCTIGDDWALFNQQPDGNECFDHFVRLFNRIKPGELGGIGFHPWVLVSDKSIWEGFNAFIEFLGEQDRADVNISYAGSYSVKILTNNQQLPQ